MADTVPALLTPGEHVMNTGAVDLIGRDNLDALNNAGMATPQWQNANAQSDASRNQMADEFAWKTGYKPGSNLTGATNTPVPAAKPTGLAGQGIRRVGNSYSKAPAAQPDLQSQAINMATGISPTTPAIDSTLPQTGQGGLRVNRVGNSFSKASPFDTVGVQKFATGGEVKPMNVLQESEHINPNSMRPPAYQVANSTGAKDVITGLNPNSMRSPDYQRGLAVGANPVAVSKPSFTPVPKTEPSVGFGEALLGKQGLSDVKNAGGTLAGTAKEMKNITDSIGGKLGTGLYDAKERVKADYQNSGYGALGAVKGFLGRAGSWAGGAVYGATNPSTEEVLAKGPAKTPEPESTVKQDAKGNFVWTGQGGNAKLEDVPEQPETAKSTAQGQTANAVPNKNAVPDKNAVTETRGNGLRTLRGPGFSVSTADQGGIISKPADTDYLTQTLKREADPEFKKRLAEQAQIVNDRIAARKAHEAAEQPKGITPEQAAIARLEQMALAQPNEHMTPMEVGNTKRRAQMAFGLLQQAANRGNQLAQNNLEAIKMNLQQQGVLAQQENNRLIQQENHEYHMASTASQRAENKRKAEEPREWTLPNGEKVKGTTDTIMALAQQGKAQDLAAVKKGMWDSDEEDAKKRAEKSAPWDAFMRNLPGGTAAQAAEQAEGKAGGNLTREQRDAATRVALKNAKKPEEQREILDEYLSVYGTPFQG